MKTNLIALLSGIVFGVGLSWSQMINPNKVLDFLDVTGHFDPSLIFVMVGALSVALITFKWIRSLPAPLFGGSFQLSKNTVIDKPLVIGSAIFGIGWGLTGYCPGPAVASLSFFSIESFVTVVAICAGLFAYNSFFEKNK
jgi:uncharacterized membrane protein YedE/YeeE